MSADLLIYRRSAAIRFRGERGSEFAAMGGGVGAAWPERDAESIIALYAHDAIYRALAFREADEGVSGVRSYLARNFTVESEVECRFDEPIADGDRAAVQWWASWVEAGNP
jgi:hypothetical protein